MNPLLDLRNAVRFVILFVLSMVTVRLMLLRDVRSYLAFSEGRRFMSKGSFVIEFRPCLIENLQFLAGASGTVTSITVPLISLV